MSLAGEPALEPCMKVQRRTGVNGKKVSSPENAFAEETGRLIRVVPPR